MEGERERERERERGREREREGERERIKEICTNSVTWDIYIYSHGNLSMAVFLPHQ